MSIMQARGPLGGSGQYICQTPDGDIKTYDETGVIAGFSIL